MNTVDRESSAVENPLAIFKPRCAQCDELVCIELTGSPALDGTLESFAFLLSSLFGAVVTCEVCDDANEDAAMRRAAVQWFKGTK